jgi:hypothetical protein
MQCQFGNSKIGFGCYYSPTLEIKVKLLVQKPLPPSSVCRMTSLTNLMEQVFLDKLILNFFSFFHLHSWGVEFKLGPLGTSAIYWPIVPAPADCEDGEFVGMNGRGNRNTRRKPAPAPLCRPQIQLDQTRD